MGVFHIFKIAQMGHTAKERSGTWDPPPETLHLGLGTWNLWVEPRTQDLHVGPRTWDPPTGTLHLEPGIL